MRHVLSRLLGRAPRSWPVPVARPEGYLVAGEQWCGYVPPEPMTHRQAEDVRVARNRMAHDDAWRRTVLASRNRMCHVNWMRQWCMTHERCRLECLARGFA